MKGRLILDKVKTHNGAVNAITGCCFTPSHCWPNPNTIIFMRKYLGAIR